jgi:hypothetical protein
MSNPPPLIGERPPMHFNVPPPRLPMNNFTQPPPNVNSDNFTQPPPNVNSVANDQRQEEPMV